MPDQVTEDVKASRNSRLLEAAAGVSTARSGRLVGRTVEVLVDGTSKKNAGELSGRTRCNRVVNFDGQGIVSVGELASVRIDQALPHSLRGTLASRPEEAACLSK
jgi:tRNA-2-methylthio-N6-dimethylallyladenosine synthase